MAPEGVWVAALDDAAVVRALAGAPAGALSGWRLAVKDNIDVAGWPTTAGCPAFAYEPEASAPVVTALVDAGAVVVGKANLDQFATGLTGARSPYGLGRSALEPARVSGGSSSGSALAVALGLADFALGTDTAGSGRVPAACNGIVGFKPTPGLLPITGIVPACRSIDCPSVFTRTVGEARAVLDVLAPRRCRSSLDVRRSRLRIGVPDETSLADVAPAARAAFDASVEALAQSDVDVDLVVVDLADHFLAGDLLYGGSFVAERYHAVGAFIEQHPDDVHPVVRSIILRAREVSGASAFGDLYRLEELAARSRAAWQGVDVLLTPTVPDVPTVEAVLADPVGTNVELGRFTTFANLLGLCVTAVPGLPREDGVPSGVSIVGRGGDDDLTLDVGSLVEGEPLPSREDDRASDRIDLAVVGAHLAGQPLHWQLADRGAALVRRTRTSSRYRLHALPTAPPKPGLVRREDGGPAALEVEVWSLDAAAFGSFVQEVPHPLAIGKVELDDGTWVSGFVCEPSALVGAPDITAHGGWRNYLASQ